MTSWWQTRSNSVGKSTSGYALSQGRIRVCGYRKPPRSNSSSGTNTCRKVCPKTQVYGYLPNGQSGGRFCADRTEKAIEAGFLAKARKIQEAYLAKLNTLAGNESSLGHEDNANGCKIWIIWATNLESWVQALGYRLGHDRKSQRP